MIEIDRQRERATEREREREIIITRVNEGKYKSEESARDRKNRTNEERGKKKSDGKNK